MKVTYTTLWEAEETFVFAERQKVFLPLIQTTPIHSVILGRPRPSCHCFVATNTGRPSDQSQPASLETAGGEGGAPGDEHNGRQENRHTLHTRRVPEAIEPANLLRVAQRTATPCRLINATALPYLLLCYGVTQIN